MLTQEQIDAIPREVRERKQWLPWRWALKLEPGKDKLDKVLVNPNDGRDHGDPEYYAAWKNPNHWLTFDEAVDAARAENLEGPGYIFAKHDPFAGCDFDYCWDPDARTIEPWADERLPKHTYCEISPSGFGIKCLGYARMPGDGTGHVKKVQALLGAPHPKAEIGCYSQGRWFAFTGRALNGSGVREIQSTIDRLDREIFSALPTATTAQAAGVTVESRVRAIPDQELIRRIAGSNEGEKFLKLFYEGDASAYPSGSEADMALCAILAFWTGRDYERTVRLFKSSAIGKLPRLKQGEAERTARRACDTAKKVWTPTVIAPAEYNIRSVAELLAKDFGEEKFVLGGILPVGGSSILASKPKVGKTTFARQLIVSTAQGNRFLERDVIRGPVVLLSFQGREADIQRHFKLLGARPDDPIFYHCARPPHGAVEKLYELADKHRPVLIVIEMLQNLIRAKETSAYGEVTLLMEPLEDIARQSGAHILMSTHLTKAERDDPLDMIIGSVSYRGSVDTSILLRRYADYRTITTEQRVGTDLPETILKWNEEQRCMYQGERRGPLERSGDEEKILVALRASDEPMTVDEITATVHGNKKKVLDALDRIEKHRSKQILKTGRGRKGDPVRYAINPDFGNVVEFPGPDFET